MKQFATLEHGNTFKFSESSRYFAMRYMSSGITNPTIKRYFGYVKTFETDPGIETTSSYLEETEFFSINVEHIHLILIIYICGIMLALMILVCEKIYFIRKTTSIGISVLENNEFKNKRFAWF